MKAKAGALTARVGTPHRRLAVWTAIATTLIIAACAGDAAARKTGPAKAGAAQQQQQPPVKLRYYGGPKYPMYPG
jgi:hypothetical protein